MNHSPALRCANIAQRETAKVAELGRLPKGNGESARLCEKRTGVTASLTRKSSTVFNLTRFELLSEPRWPHSHIKTANGRKVPKCVPTTYRFLASNDRKSDRVTGGR